MGGAGFALGLLGLFTGEVLECVRNEKIRSYQPDTRTLAEKQREKFLERLEWEVDCCYMSYLNLYSLQIILCPPDEYKRIFRDMCKHTNYIDLVQCNRGLAGLEEDRFYQEKYPDFYQTYLSHRMPTYRDDRVKYLIKNNDEMLRQIKIGNPVCSNAELEKKMDTPTPRSYTQVRTPDFEKPLDREYYKQMIKYYNPWYKFIGDPWVELMMSKSRLQKINDYSNRKDTELVSNRKIINWGLNPSDKMIIIK